MPVRSKGASTSSAPLRQPAAEVPSLEAVIKLADLLRRSPPLCLLLACPGVPPSSTRSHGFNGFRIGFTAEK